MRLTRDNKRAFALFFGLMAWGVYSHYAGKQKKRLTFSRFVIAIVENIGFEPMPSCMPCKRSNQLS